ncbi:hypothetical protein ACHAXR_006594 [Thalassiosira sp. AJA248-18]
MDKDQFYKHEVPTFEDINNDNDIQKMGDNYDVYPNEDAYDQAVVASRSHPSAAGGGGNDVSKSIRYRGRRRYNGNSYEGEEADDGDGRHYFYDPTIAHVKTGLILLPLEMTLPITIDDGSIDGVCDQEMVGERDEAIGADSREEETIEDDGGGDTSSKDPQSSEAGENMMEPKIVPSFSINRSRLSLFAAFPPPPIVLQPNDDVDCRMYDQTDLNHAQQRLKQYSGFHGAMGMTSATTSRLGYSDTLLSINYRLPTLLSLPSLHHPSLLGYNKKKSIRQQKLIGNVHYNLLLGSAATTKTSLGSTISSLDGRTRVQWDIGNPFYPILTSHNQSNACLVRNSRKKGGILSPSPQSDYTLSVTRDFVCTSSPLRANCMMKLSPLPPPTFLSTNSKSNSMMSASSLSSLHLQHFHLTLTNNMDTNNENCVRGVNAKRMREGLNNRHPKLSLSLGYGMPLAGGEGLWWVSQTRPTGGAGSHQSGTDGCGSAMHHNHNAIHNNKTTALASSSYSTNVKLDIKQSLSRTQSCHGTLEYQHAGQILSFGTMAIRTFSSSRFSRLGVGVQYALELGNIFSHDCCPWWKGSTRWLFQLERGDVRFLVPVTIYPHPLAAWDLLTRVLYSFLASIVVDTIVGELLCGVTSKLRLNFLKLFLGEEKVGTFISSPVDDTKKEREDEELWMQQHLVKAQDDTTRQVNLMMRQANATTKREQEQGGLVIVKAVYGVMDNQSCQWVRRTEKSAENINVDTQQEHVMDATTQLQFWVSDSSLNLPAVSKKHMLGFYDILSYVSKDDWTMHQTPLNKQGGGEGKNRSNNSFTFSLAKWWKGKMRADEEDRKLVVVLSVRYKWDDKLYDMMFYDDEAVDLPSQFAQEVSAVVE